MASVAESVRSQYSSNLLLQQACLDFEAVHEVPDSHAWPQLEDYPGGGGGGGGEDDEYHHHEYSAGCNSSRSHNIDGEDYSTDHLQSYSCPIPVIDLSDAEAVGRMGRACETWGVFQVINHGVPMRLLDDVEFQARRLFALPAQQKLKAARSSPDGLTGYGIARIATFFSKLLWSEGFTIAGSPAEHARLLWSRPHDSSQFCEVMEEYDREMKKLARRLMWQMLASLGISKEEVAWGGPGGEVEGASAMFHLNWYPACPNPERAMGLAEHTDSPLFAILYQNSTTGLQVLDAGGGHQQRWVTVPPLPGALVVNVGDLLHILTNGRFKSVMHRAVVNRTRHRLSVAYFWGPPSNVCVSPLEKLVGPDTGGPLYPSMSWSEYLKIKANHFNDSLSLLRLRQSPPVVVVDDDNMDQLETAATTSTPTSTSDDQRNTSTSSGCNNSTARIKAF